MIENTPKQSKSKTMILKHVTLKVYLSDIGKYDRNNSM